MSKRVWLLIGPSIAVLITIVAVVMYVQWWSIQRWYIYGRHAANINMSVSATSYRCTTADKPLMVYIQNNSSRILEKATWTYLARIEGHSDNLVGGVGQSSDYILKPGEAVSQCFSWPATRYAIAGPKDGEAMKQLKWSINWRDYRFED